mmetsp:Transcript_7119/g.21697  ORF Transcript_7119/g.21697 Transcript_7119/m.21697 type:complete len:468 (-) Transcript_7119:760-2163(-)
MRPRSLQNFKVPKHVGLKQACEVLRLHDLETVIVQPPSVGNHNVDLAVCLEHKRHDRVRGLRDVAVLGDRGAAQRRDLRDHLVGPLPRAVVHDDLCAPRREDLRVGAAQATTAARDEGHAAIEPHLLCAEALQLLEALGKLGVGLERSHGALHVVHANQVLAEAKLLEQRLLKVQQRQLERDQVLPDVRLVGLEPCENVLGRRGVVDLLELLLELRSLVLGGEGLVGDRAQVVSGELGGVGGLADGRHVISALAFVPAQDQDGGAVHPLLLGILDVIGLVEGALLQAPGADLPKGRERVDALGHAAELAVLRVALQHLVVPLIVHTERLQGRRGHLFHGLRQLLRVGHHVGALGTEHFESTLRCGRGQNVHDVALDGLCLLKVVELPQAAGGQVGRLLPGRAHLVHALVREPGPNNAALAVEVLSLLRLYARDLHAVAAGKLERAQGVGKRGVDLTTLCRDLRAAIG